MFATKKKKNFRLARTRQKLNVFFFLSCVYTCAISSNALNKVFPEDEKNIENMYFVQDVQEKKRQDFLISTICVSMWFCSYSTHRWIDEHLIKIDHWNFLVALNFTLHVVASSYAAQTLKRKSHHRSVCQYLRTFCMGRAQIGNRLRFAKL